MNLAFETCLFRYVEKQMQKENKVFFVALWQNDNAIIIGRNQNPLAECDLNAVEKYGINIARRITGGGAVYHDKGNLNFSFILPKEYHNPQHTSQVLANAIRAMGLNAELSGRNDLTIDGRKFSGNAYFSSKFAGLHHGTVLIKTSFKRLGEVLTPDKLKMKNAQVASVKSSVVNLTELLPDITRQEICESIIDSFSSYVKSLVGEATEVAQFDNDLIVADEIERQHKLHSSKKWVYGESLGEPTLKGYFTWGSLSIYFFRSGTKVDTCEFVTDCISLRIWEHLKEILSGCEFTRESLIGKIEPLLLTSNESETTILSDVINLLNKL